VTTAAPHADPAASRTPPSRLARVLLPFALGYFLSYLYRVVNAVIGADLARDLGVDAAALGLLTSAYFLCFAAFQIPLGVLLDRYGPRRVESALLLVAAAGAVVFALAPSVPMLVVGRGLIGFGVSACLMGAIKANVQWLPPERLPLANGFIIAWGGLGALTATVPVEAALGVTDWRGVFLGLAAVTLAIAAAIFLVVPDAPGRPAGESWGAAFRDALRIFVQPQFLRVVPLSTLTQASFLAYNGLWAAPWLRDIAGLDRPGVAAVLAFGAAGILCGNLAMGFAADRLGRRGVTTLTVAVGGSIVYMALQGALILGLPAPNALMWFLFAVFGSGISLYYAALSQAFDRRLAGRVNTAANMMVFAASFLLQWLIGEVLALWPAEAGGGIPAEAHTTVMAGILALEVLSLLWLWAAPRRRGTP